MSTIVPEIPQTSFENYVEDAALLGAGVAGDAQQVELFAHGASIGWLGQDDGQWCVAARRDAAVSLESYIYKGVLYFRNAADTSRYLSVSDGYHYVGFYNWIGARGWIRNGDVLTSLYTNEPLSYWSSDNGFIYANSGNGFTPLTVAFR